MRYFQEPLRLAATYLVTDEGNGLRAGRAEAMTDVVRQSDTYHAIAHQLGSWTNRLEKPAYKAIADDQECETKPDSAKRDRVQEKRLQAYRNRRLKARKTRRHYTMISDIYIFVFFENSMCLTVEVICVTVLKPKRQYTPVLHLLRS